jgi:hypothetical protein
LAALEGADLIAVKRVAGRKPLVTILDLRADGKVVTGSGPVTERKARPLPLAPWLDSTRVKDGPSP